MIFLYGPQALCLYKLLRQVNGMAQSPKAMKKTYLFLFINEDCFPNSIIRIIPQEINASEMQNMFLLKSNDARCNAVK